MMSKYARRLNYSFGNEDWNAEEKALRIGPRDRVLCITASGDRPLHTLLANPGQVVALDGNAIQSHLLSLKCAALRDLPFDNYISFLGGAPQADRVQQLSKLAKLMPLEAASYWRQHPRAVHRGILFQGALERNCARVFSRCLSALRGPILTQLFSCKDLDEQRRLVRDRWDRRMWRLLFRVALNRRLMSVIALDPGLYRYVDPTLRPGTYFYEKMTHSLSHCLVRHNPFLSLVFTGTVEKEAFLPYLKEPYAEIIRSRLDRLSLHTSDVIHYLESSASDSFDCYSLSDIASYMPQESFIRLLRAMIRTARPGARFCIRQFLSNHQIPPELKPYYEREPQLEQHLDREDICFWPRFMVGSIKK